MKPPPFAYYRPSSVAQATARMAAEAGAVPLAGGQSLVPLLNLRLARPSTVVDLGAIVGLDSIDTGDGFITVGAAVTHSRLEHCQWPPGFEAVVTGVGQIGYPAIRHRGTLGGSLAHADPAAELPCLVVAFDARIELASPDDTRTVPADEFFVGYYDTVRSPDELVTAVTFPVFKSMRSGFAELSRRRGDFALALAAVTNWRDAAGPQSRVVVGGLDVRPRRIPELEAAVTEGGNAWRELPLVEVLARHVHPTDDIHASADYRLHLGGEMVGRAMVQMGGA